jgi:hypothetical protein
LEDAQEDHGKCEHIFVKCIKEVSKSTFTASSLSDAEDVVEKAEAEAEAEAKATAKADVMMEVEVAVPVPEPMAETIQQQP